MASDSEGLRLRLFLLKFFLSLLKMASDSEGLRREIGLRGIPSKNVENGFRFGRVTTLTVTSTVVYYSYESSGNTVNLPAVGRESGPRVGEGEPHPELS